MHRSIAFLLLLSLVLFVPAGAAFAADPEDVADQVDPRGYYIEGAVVDFEVMENLVARVTNSETRFYFVALADDPVEGTDEFAEEVLARLDQGATVIVISPGEIGARSDDFSSAELDQAADAAVGDADRSIEADFRVFAESLVAVSAGTTATTSGLTTTTRGSAAGESSGSGGSGALIFLAILDSPVRQTDQAGRRPPDRRSQGGDPEAARCDRQRDPRSGRPGDPLGTGPG